MSADGAVIARCKNEYDLSHSQRTVCIRQPELIPVIEGAEEAAREACEQQFGNDRWNCSGFEFLNASPARTHGRCTYTATIDQLSVFNTHLYYSVPCTTPLKHTALYSALHDLKLTTEWYTKSEESYRIS